ncbi:BMP-binding endothelial regulator protein-like [Amphibalanus amphitrite]|uniref:BMP-binding endothelial regulator protein-like n=1 Tax=Amphibalanus amphitrite TaxID=1232801 RepID=UPI001C9063A9|nr:BMP-binding endothelial regulator protein-like [Amphibalanus amphitrite]
MSPLWALRCLLGTVLLLVPAHGSTPTFNFPKGRLQKCTNEGEIVQLSFIKTNPCITCRCRDGLVICDHERCDMTKTCHLLLLGQRIRPDSCCEQCKGCTTPDGAHKEGDEWPEPSDPCRVNHCFSGVITQSTVKCHTPCANPLPPAPGECCPRCPSCLLSGQVIAPGEQLTPRSDPCMTCQCDRNGTQSCSKRVCPALSCPASKTVRDQGQCCPRCKGTRRIKPSDGCVMGKRRFSAGQNFTLDPCTQCSCQGSTSVCARQSCPELACPLVHQVYSPDRCCPVCRRPERVRRVCRYAGQTYQDGSTFKLNSCTKCVCNDGQIDCELERCDRNMTCPPGHHAAKLTGQCCEQCVEDDAVCTVFGDPHYNTFDGKIYNYQGTCKYVLAKDCADRSFSVRVNNDARKSRFFSWTRSVSIKAGGLRISLRQKGRVKVNGRFEELPFVEMDHAIIYQDPTDNFNVVLKLVAIGVRVTWDGDSFLQVKVPPSYKNKMCGLCGNYNGVRSDDFTTKRGKRVRSARRFGRSWRIGGRSRCSAGSRRKSRKNRKRQPSCKDRASRANAVRQCNRLKSPLFAGCHAKVHPASYFKSCVQDMCECDHKRSCYCEAMTAYAHDCQRKGVFVDWLEGTDCAVHRRCPTGARYVACRSPCQPSCAVPEPPAELCSADVQCQPGCVCPEGTLLHRGVCVPPMLCPNR